MHADQDIPELCPELRDESCECGGLLPFSMTHKLLRRSRRVPKHQDVSPDGITVSLESNASSKEQVDDVQQDLQILKNTPSLQTQANKFRVYKIYQYPPTYDPDGQLTLEDLAGLTSSDPN